MKPLIIKSNFFSRFIAFALIIYIAYSFVTFSAVNDPNDDEAELIEMRTHKAQTVEGGFLDANGITIFDPKYTYDEDSESLPVEYSYLLGYNSPVYDSSGLRRLYSEHLYNDLGTGKGGSIQLTIDNVLQKKAYAALKSANLEGSVIVMNAKNAEILAMAERRRVDYNVNLIESKWEEYNSGTIEGMLYSPATGDYKAPGSVFKVLTAAAAYKNGLEDYQYEDTGVLTVNQTEIHNAFDIPQGLENLQSALTHSTNTYFGSLSLELGERAMKGIFSDFLVGETIDVGFTTLHSTCVLDGTDENLAMVGFGQGKVALSPLHIAMIGQSIVNNGKMIKPTVVKTMYDANGNTVFRNTEHELLTQTLKPEIAESVRKLMRGVTENNDPHWLEFTPNVYCKTGTAQITDGKKLYNSYMLCMTDDYVILVSVNNTTRFGSEYTYIVQSFLKELY